MECLLKDQTMETEQKAFGIEGEEHGNVLGGG